MPELEFIANMNISPVSVEYLKKRRIKIDRISDVLDERAKDIDIINFARKNNKVIITQDLDFSILLAIKGYKKPSVITLRMENVRPKFVAMRIIDIVKEMERELKEGVVISVDEMSIRYKSLPIKIAI